MIKQLFILVFIIFFSFHISFASDADEPISVEIAHQYDEIEFGETKPDFNAFLYGMAGYYHLHNTGKIKNNILSIADFSVSANQERLWVIDMDNKSVIYRTLVAHGMNTGEEYAHSFSNNSGSHQSSLGFFLTESIYNGRHDVSLRLDGLEYGYNHNARERGIVLHGADYVNHQYVKTNGRLGRSHGCPALPPELNGEIVNTIQGKSCFFIYYPDEDYLSNSPIINELDLFGS